MSDIGLKGVAGFVMIGATTLLMALVALIATGAAVIVSSRRSVLLGRTLARYASGPVAATMVAVAGLGWAWDGPSAWVDRLSPVFALGSIVVGAAVGVVVRRSLPGPRHLSRPR